ncbi:dihydrofolate reductase family protein [Conexibacter sp. JD483]|uniref:dihydrofolate reductase family protein n=1 Tax=unclassified Conexibacter TaxID=2627773 RepID=UPI0027255CB8|nr:MULTISPECIES: dihydrofolate reductase family protein [unclassified Conexibacter]MDO8188308.1 dihydrofolate reductase family protein [Conexibacter sp. CPCC 205706]MDO8198988.1 dihydrofolate reductase family protein [Conexibacter sp. CPCC 205762]MDR9372799.1 dihydrofolate reductase family protein [Conexibacter sp. JD483]
MQFNRLLPDPGPVELTDLLHALDLAARAPAERPYVISNFAATLDGRIAIDGRSGGIGDDGDHAVFRHLRTQADALLVGTGTIAHEQYGRPLRAADLREVRTRLGLDPAPPLVTITRSGRLPLEIPLFQDPEAHVIVYTPQALAPPAVPARVQVHRVDEEHDGPLGAAALRHLRAEHGVRSVLCEGGPLLLSSLLHGGLVDELFLTTAPLLAGGGPEFPMTSGDPLQPPLPLELVWALERNGSLYTRHRVAIGGR